MVSDFLATYRYYLDDLAFVVLLIKRYGEGRHTWLAEQCTILESLPKKK